MIPESPTIIFAGEYRVILEVCYFYMMITSMSVGDDSAGQGKREAA